MSINAPGKALVAIAGLITIAVLHIFGELEAGLAGTSATGIVMYILGNGITARSGKVAEPVIAPSPTASRLPLDPPKG